MILLSGAGHAGAIDSRHCEQIALDCESSG